MKTEKKEYTAPALAVVTFKVEQGYAASNGSVLVPNEVFLFSETEDKNMEQWESDNSYLDYDW